MVQHQIKHSHCLQRTFVPEQMLTLKLCQQFSVRRALWARRQHRLEWGEEGRTPGPAALGLTHSGREGGLILRAVGDVGWVEVEEWQEQILWF